MGKGMVVEVGGGMGGICWRILINYTKYKSGIILLCLNCALLPNHLISIPKNPPPAEDYYWWHHTIKTLIRKLIAKFDLPKYIWSKFSKRECTRFEVEELSKAKNNLEIGKNCLHHCKRAHPWECPKNVAKKRISVF